MASAQTLNNTQTKFAATAMRSVLNIDKDIEKRIKSEVFQRGIRIRDFFYDFDKLRKGFVTEDKFKTALSMFNIFMTKDDVEELTRRYSIGNGYITYGNTNDLRLVRYDEFIQHIDAQFFDYDHARNNIHQTRSQAIFDDKESHVLNRVLRNITNMIKTKRILLKIPFQDFDRTNTGHVTKEQFTRVLTTLGINLDYATYDLLARRYMDKGTTKDVNYVKFWQEVDDLQSINTVVDPKHNHFSTYEANDEISDPTKLDFVGSLYLTKRLTSDKDTLEVEKKIQAEVVMKKLRVKEFFRDFDGLRKGTISEAQFRRVLDMTGILISDDEYKTLLTKYKVKDLVNYRDFIDNIDRVFTIKGIDKDPLAKVESVDSDTTLAARRKFFDINEEEWKTLEQLIGRYREEIRNRRVLLKPHFMDFDRTRTGHISKNQFLRIITQFGLCPDKESINLLFRRYTDKGNLDEVNYYDFCKDIDLYDVDAKDISKTYYNSFFNPDQGDRHPTSFIKNDVPNDLLDLLAKIRRKAKQQRIRIQEFLKDFDKLRSGGITLTQLRLGFDMAGIQLSDHEFGLLVTNFPFESKENYVKWRGICDAIDEVFATKGLEKAPLVDYQQPPVSFNYGKASLTNEEIHVANKALHRFTKFARGTRLDIKQFFKDWDRLNRNKVSPKQFRQVLATVNFLLSDSEYNALVKYYRSEEDDEVQYVNFINDAQLYKDLNLEPAKHSHKATDFSGTGYQSIYLGLGSTLPNGPIDFNVLLGKIKTHIKVNQLRVEDYFKDFDPLRKGTIPFNKFRGVLSKMKIDGTETELSALEERYKLDNGEYPLKINYEAFIREIEQVFTQKGLEKDPIVKPKDFQPPAEIKQQLTEDEERELHDYMVDLGHNVFKHRILIKPYFQDKDRTKSGKVSFPRFRSVLDVLKLKITDRFYELLCKKFSHEGKEFNYVEFIEVLKRYSEFDQIQAV